MICVKEKEKKMKNEREREKKKRKEKKVGEDVYICFEVSKSVFFLLLSLVFILVGEPIEISD